MHWKNKQINAKWCDSTPFFYSELKNFFSSFLLAFNCYQTIYTVTTAAAAAEAELVFIFIAIYRLHTYFCYVRLQKLFFLSLD